MMAKRILSFDDDFASKEFFKGSIIVDDTMRNGREYNGSEIKLGVTIDGSNYILKRQKKDWLNVQSELIASRFIKYLGGNVHTVLPGIYDNEQVVLCKDFTDIGSCLKTLASLNSSSIDTDDFMHEYYVDDIIYELAKIRNLDVSSALQQFYWMFIYDAILGNSDRHKGNFGVLSAGEKHVMAPIFDNGACLFPRNHRYVIDCDWMYERVFTFPNSKIMFCEKPLKERSSYAQVISDGRIPDEVLKQAQNLDVVAVMQKVCDDFGITGIQASYYKTIVFYRYECIIKQKHFRWCGML